MSFFSFVDHITNVKERFSEEEQKRVFEKSSQIFRLNGSFPTSIDLKRNIKLALDKQSARPEQIPFELCNEIIAPIRFISLANQALYSRGKPVIDLKSIGSIFGVTRIADRLDELGSLSSLSDYFKGRASFLVAYQNALLKSQLAQRIYTCLVSERFPSTLSYFTTSVSELLPLGMAFYRPDLYASFWLESELSDSLTFEKSIKQIFSISYQEEVQSFIAAIGLPKPIYDYLTLYEVAPWHRKSWPVANTEENRKVAHAGYVSSRLVSSICTFEDRQEFYALLRGLEGKGYLNRKILDNSLLNISSRFINNLQMLKLPTLRLPDHLEPYEDQIVDNAGVVEELDLAWSQISQRFNPFMFELKACFQDGSSSRIPQIIHCTALSLLRGLSFDRVIFFQVESTDQGKVFVPKLVIGRKVQELASLNRVVGDLDQYAPDKTAFYDKRATFTGDPLIGDDWPFVSFPLISGAEVFGMVYADKRKSKDAPPLTIEEQVSCIALAELWQSVPESLL